MKIQSKLLLHSLTFILIALVIMSFVIVKTNTTQRTSNEFSTHLLKIEQLNSSIVSFQLAIGNYGRNPTEQNQIFVQSKYRDMLVATNILDTIPTAPIEEKRRVQFINEKIYVITEFMNITQMNAANAIQLSSKINGILNDLYLLQMSMNERYQQVEQTQQQQIYVISISSGLMLILVSSIFIIIITRRIAKPIKQLNLYSKKIASGDLSINDLDISSRDEVGQLAHSFNRMKHDLSNRISEIKSNANELKEKNQRINDSIHYAKRIQETVIPHEQELNELLFDHFLIWRPRDVVGGDFYWSHKTSNGFYLAVGDCTGHGVPGALMTTLSISALNHIAESEQGMKGNPAYLLEQLNRTLKKQLNQESKVGPTDDGLDIGLCYIEGSQLIYAGAKLSLYLKQENHLQSIKGNKKSVGNRRTPIDYTFTNHHIDGTDAILYLTTDGYIDQNGGTKDYSFGKSRFSHLIETLDNYSLTDQCLIMNQELENYKGSEPQRDDITVLGFKVISLD